MLDSTLLYYTLPYLYLAYLILLNSTMALRDLTTLYHGSTLLDTITLYFSLVPRHQIFAMRAGSA